MSSFSPRYLARLARYGDEDAKAELRRRFADDAGAYDEQTEGQGKGKPQGRAEGDGAQ
jgi:hypothetical protein